jgi:hypothetical protein
MGHIKEPVRADFIVDPIPLKDEDRKKDKRDNCLLQSDW